MILKNKNGFSAAELVFTITILIILTLIAFLSYDSYNKSARDSSRLTDLSLINQSISLFHTERSVYPQPNSATNITYSGAIIWKQGLVGDGVLQNLGVISKKPVDPLTANEYTYSLSQKENEYQLSCALEVEKDNETTASHFIDQSYAAGTREGFAKVLGNYNGVVTFVNTGGIDYALAIPSLISGDLTQTDIVQTIIAKELVYNSFANVPSNMSHEFQDRDFDYNPASIVAWSGSLSDLKKGKDYKALSEKLEDIYSNSVLRSFGTYLNLSADTEKMINKSGNGKFSVYANCDKVASAGKIINDGVFTVKSSDGSYSDKYCPLISGNPYPSSALSVDLLNGKAWVNDNSISLTSLFSVTRSGTSTYENEDGSISIFSPNTLRYGNKGLLVEEAKTNLVPSSTVFQSGSPWWQLIAATTTADTAIAPDGTTTADTLTFTSGSIRRMTVFNPSGITAGQIYTFSIWVKGVAGDQVGPFIYNGATGSWTQNNTTIATGNWQRVSVSANITGTSDTRFGIANDNGAITANPLFIWGAQIEQGSFASSYIPTTGATLTRGRDTISITGSNFSNWYTSSEGTLFVDYNTSSNASSRSVASINSNAGDTNFAYRIMSGASSIQLASNNAGTNQYVEYISPSGGSTIGSFRVVMASQANNFAGTINGSTPTTDTSGTLVTSNRLDIGATGPAYFMDIGYVKTIVFWPLRKPNTELQALSTQP